MAMCLTLKVRPRELLGRVLLENCSSLPDLT